MFSIGSSKYLKDGRLADLIAGLTALGAYRYYKLSFEKAAEKISNEPDQAAYWEAIFRDHPEFFRIVDDRRKVSLVWRRQFKKNFDPKTSREIAKDELDGMSWEERSELSRRPLNSDETVALIDIALRSHQRAVEAERLRKWWVPIATAVLGFVGGLVGAIIGSSSPSPTPGIQEETPSQISPS